MSAESTLVADDVEVTDIKSLGFDPLKIKKAALVIRSVNHKLRQQIIKMLMDKESLTVTQIYVHLRLEQSVVSQQLSILRKTGVVGTRRDGKFIYYFVNKGRLRQITNLCNELIHYKG
jgi:DNA-binding transcriptional ArsR family regulator